jgi:hypothetical protein
MNFLAGLCFGYFIKPYIDIFITIVKNTLKK